MKDCTSLALCLSSLWSAAACGSAPHTWLTTSVHCTQARTGHLGAGGEPRRQGPPAPSPPLQPRPCTSLHPGGLVHGRDLAAARAHGTPSPLYALAPAWWRRCGPRTESQFVCTGTLSRPPKMGRGAPLPPSSRRAKVRRATAAAPLRRATARCAVARADAGFPGGGEPSLGEGLRTRPPCARACASPSPPMRAGAGGLSACLC